MRMVNFCVYLCIFFNLYLYVNCFTPGEYLCADEECTKSISDAKGTIVYNADRAWKLSFNPGQKITILGKKKGINSFWYATIDGKKGFVPSNLIKESQLYYSTDKLIPVFLKRFSDNENSVPQKKNDVKYHSDKNINREPPQSYEKVASVAALDSNLQTDNQDIKQASKVIDKSHSDKSFYEKSNSILNAYNNNILPTKSDNVIDKTTVFHDTLDEITHSSTADLKIHSQTAPQFVSSYTKSESLMGNNNSFKIFEDMNNVDEYDSSETKKVKNSVKNEKPTKNLENYYHNNNNKSDKNTINYYDKTNNKDIKDDNLYNKADYTEKNVFNYEKNNDFIIKQQQQQQEQQQQQQNDKRVKKLTNVLENVVSSSTILSNNLFIKSETVEKVQNLLVTASGNSHSIRSENTLISEQAAGDHIKASNIINPVDSQLGLNNEVTKNERTDDKNLENFNPKMYSISFTPSSVKSTTVLDIQNKVVEKEFVSGTLNEPNSMSNVDFSAIAMFQTENNQRITSSQSESNALNSSNLHITPALNSKANHIKSDMEISDNLLKVTKNKIGVNVGDTYNEMALQHSSYNFDADVSVKPTTAAIEKSTSLIMEAEPTLINNVTSTFVDFSESESTAGTFPLFSQITSIVPDRFSTDSKKDETNYEKKNEIAKVRSSNLDTGKVNNDLNSMNSGGSKNLVKKSEYKESTAAQTLFNWKYWFPHNISGSGNTFLYLVTTAVTVLLFTLGHNLIEKKGKSGRLIAKINILEQELFVTSKECLLLKDELKNAKEKMALSENLSNDELIVSLQAELEESKKARSELESSVEILQQELDAATEAGLDLNKMLSEVLTQKGGSESLLESVENLQTQLNSQQKVIDEMTKKLGVKNKENETLQAALEAANEKVEYLEDQITNIKSKLDTEKNEKEEITRDLKLQVSELKVRINELNESNEKEISKLKEKIEILQKTLTDTSNALAVKEEECKRIKISFKQMKTKGTSNLDALFDVCRIQAELHKIEENNKVLLEQLAEEKSVKIALETQIKSLELEVQKQEKNMEEAKKKEDEAMNKLEVLSNYFKEKETQLQKELGLQEALWAQKKGNEKTVYNMLKSLQEEVDSYKLQNETLKKEILDQERGLKNQIANLEQKAYDNWVAARQAERKLEDSKQETAQLRNRLTLIEKIPCNEVEGKGNHRAEELNGLEPTSPVHDTSSPLLFPPLPLDPNNSALLPHGFMPHPMFMPPPMGGFLPPPPFLPGDRRPPPLGRMSSPPLNSQFSPPPPSDYSFERMSPLSPHNRNYRCFNEDDKEKEQFRHKSPLYPPSQIKNWDDNHGSPGFIPISSQRDLKREHKGSNVSSQHSSSDSLDQSSKHSVRV